MSKYIEHEVDWFLTDEFESEYTGLPNLVIITINDGFNEPYLFYSNNSSRESTYNDLSVISFDGYVLKGNIENLSELRQWISLNKKNLIKYWNGTLSTIPMRKNLIKV